MGRTWRGSMRGPHGTKKKENRRMRGRAADNFGRYIEKKAVGLLERMVRDNLIDKFLYHPYEYGRDFTVMKDGVERFFDVTGSSAALKTKRKQNRPYPIIYISPVITELRVREWVIELFNAQD